MFTKIQIANRGGSGQPAASATPNRLVRAAQAGKFTEGSKHV